MSGTRDQRANVPDSEFRGPTVIQGEQHIHQYAGSASAPSPSSPQDQRLRAQAEHEHLRKMLLRVAWICSAASWSVGGFLSLAHLVRDPELSVLFWTATPLALVGAAVDIAFFRLRLRWEQQGCYWLSTKKPTMGYEVLVRILLILLILFIIAGYHH